MTVLTHGIGVESKLKSEELLHVACAHAKKLPNYPKIRFGVKSDTEDDLEKPIYSILQIIPRIMKEL